MAYCGKSYHDGRTVIKNLTNMSDPENSKLDGNTMTTMDNDNRTMITEKEEGMALDSLIEAGDQAQAMIGGDVIAETVDDLPVVDLPVFFDVDAVAAVEEVPAVADVVDVLAVEEAPMVASIDPAMCSFSSAFMSADESVVVGSPPSDVVIPASLVPEKEKEVEFTEEEEEFVGKGKKVVGRRQVVVVDDDDPRSSKSAASVDEVTSLASSSGIKRKGFKRGRSALKDGNLVDERKMDDGSSLERSLERRKKRKGKKKEVRVTPEKEVDDGKCEEAKEIIEQALDDLSSSVLGGAIMEWANSIDEIRVKSKKLQGKLSGEIKRCVTKIKEGTTLLVIRSEATGDPHFLRMRNAELVSQLREAVRENVRLEEQLKRMSPKTSPPRKKRVQKMAVTSDSAGSAPVDSVAKTSGAFSSLIREAFPPLPQRPPRGANVTIKSGSDRVTPVAGTSSVIPSGSVDAESGMEAYYTRRISALVTARDSVIEKRHKEQLGKEQAGSQERRNEKEADKDGNRGRIPKDGGPKVGPRILSDV